MAEKHPAVDPDQVLRQALAMVAPGTVLRDGLERIVLGRTGGLIVLGHDKVVEQASGGGFNLDVEFTATRLRELAKMDGAIIVDQAVKRLAWANVQLMPDATIHSDETGTRHRTAERVARSIGVGVVSVSEEAGTITLYEGDQRRQLQDTDSLIGRANHLLQTLERFRSRADDVLTELDRAELEEAVTVGQVATIVQRLEMVVRVARSVGELVTELGSHRRLLRLQLAELIAGVFEERRLVVIDYVSCASEADLEAATEAALTRLTALTHDQLLVLEQVAAALGVRVPGGSAPLELDAPAVPRGRRLLRHVPHVPVDTVDGLVAHFGSLSALRRATLDELAAHAGEREAAIVRSGLDRLLDGAGTLQRLRHRT